ncbi:MAG TPA: Uma2 family endonuclease [Pseudolabrys sp.]|nr:Uma2 family endonuclease [Pseudolabrys sp.]
MTVAEFEKLPAPPGGYYELRHGEAVLVPPPQKLHNRVRRRLFLLLEARLRSGGYVDVEVGFRPAPEHNILVADVAFVSAERWAAIGDHEWLSGSPELVIEVLSPSNSAKEMNDKEQLCLGSEGQQFWAVDPDLRLVKVTTRDGLTRTYRGGATISLADFGGETITVDSIFEAKS